MFTDESKPISHLILNSIISAAFLFLLGLLFLILRNQSIPNLIYNGKEINLQKAYSTLFLGGAIMCVTNVIWNLYVSKFWWDRNNAFMDILCIILGFAGFFTGCAFILGNTIGFNEATSYGFLSGYSPATFLEKAFVSIVLATCISLNFSFLYSFIMYARDEEEWEIFSKIHDGIINWATVIGAGVFLILSLVFIFINKTVIIKVILFISLAPYIIQIISMLGQAANKDK